MTALPSAATEVFAPSPALQAHVNFYALRWRRREAEQPAHVCTTHLPALMSGTLTFVFSGAIALRRADGSLGSPGRGFVAGATTQASASRDVGLTASFSVVFKPGAMQRFVHASATETADRLVSLDAIWGHGDADRIESQLAEATSGAARVRIVEQALLSRLSARERADRANLALPDSTLLRLGRASVAGLAREVGLGMRQFQRRFNAQFGLGPRTFGRMLRFYHALHLFNSASAHRRLRWVEIAQHCGYADQAHFARDFKAYTGIAPTALHAGIEAHDPSLWAYSIERDLTTEWKPWPHDALDR